MRKANITRNTELKEKISENTRLNPDDVGLMMKGLAFSLVDSMQEEGDKVTIMNVGTFTVTKRRGKVDKLDGIPKEREDKLYFKFKPAKNFIPYVEQDKKGQPC